MVSLFSEIQGFFDSKYSGRFLSLLLRELGAREPGSFVAALGLPKEMGRRLKRGELEVVHEHRFATKEGTLRIADLAVLSRGEPLIFIEVKEDDINSKSNPAQLRDYLSMLGETSKGEAIWFIHISRYALPPAERELMASAGRTREGVRSVSYRSIFRELSRQDVGPWGVLFRDYLEDIGVANYSSIDLAPAKDGKALAMLLTQMLGFPHTHGLGKLHSDKAADLGPELMQRLLKNMKSLSDWLVDANPGLFSQRFTRKFLPRPYFDLDKLSKQDLSGDEEVLPGKSGAFVRSGEVYFYAQGKISNQVNTETALSSNDWLYLEMGYVLHIARGGVEVVRDGLVGVQMYAAFYGSGDINVFESSSERTDFPTEAQAQKYLSKCLKKAAASAAKQAKGARAEALSSFQVPDPE